MSPHGFVYQVDIVKREAPGRPPVNLPQVAWKASSSYWGVGGPLQGSVCVRPVAAVLRGRHSRNNLNGYVSKTSYIDENAWFASPALAITDVRHEIFPCMGSHERRRSTPGTSEMGQYGMFCAPN